MPLSDESRVAAQPLLKDCDISTPDALRKEEVEIDALRALEDGSESGSEFEALKLQRRPGFWTRLRMSIRRRRHVESQRFGSERHHPGEPKSRRRRKRSCCLLVILVIGFFFFLQILNSILGYIPFLTSNPSALDWVLPSPETLLDITNSVTPIPCHSHNDYWRPVPLYDALRWGCTGVEADVWLQPSSELFVGHSRHALTPTRTFLSMYVDPLVAMLDHRNANSPPSTNNGVFDLSPEQTLVLLVDFKTDGHALFPIVSEHLKALREKNYLSYFNGNKTIEGPITVVATGNAPFDLITANATYRDIFFDAPLDRMTSSPSSKSNAKRGGQGTVGTTPTSSFDSTNSYYASVNFLHAVGWTYFGISARQIATIRAQIKGAHERGLKARYWGNPTWPKSLRDKVWRVMLEEGVDYLNGDDLVGMKGLYLGEKAGIGGLVRRWDD